MERVMGIGPTWPAWKAGALPLSYTRVIDTMRLLLPDFQRTLSVPFEWGGRQGCRAVVSWSREDSDWIGWQTRKGMLGRPAPDDEELRERLRRRRRRYRALTSKQ